MCALLSLFADENLVPQFQQWRMPVSDKSVLEVAKRYELKQVCAATDLQFAREYAAGKIHLDPLSLRIRIQKAADGSPVASVFHIFKNTPGAVVRHTLDNTPVDVSSKTIPNEPMPVAAGTTINAALFVSGKARPVLVTSTKVTAD